MIELFKSVVITSAEVFVPNSTDTTIMHGTGIVSSDLYNHSGDNNLAKATSVTLSGFDNGDGTVSDRPIGRYLIIQ